MAKVKKEVKKENLVVRSKVYGLVKSAGLRIGGDFVPALSDKIHALIQASVQKVQAEGRKKTLNVADLV